MAEKHANLFIFLNFGQNILYLQFANALATCFAFARRQPFEAMWYKN